MPEVAFVPFFLSRAVAVSDRMPTFLAVKGVCTDFFKKLARNATQRPRYFGLKLTILTIAQMPCDWEIKEHLVCQLTVRLRVTKRCLEKA